MMYLKKIVKYKAVSLLLTSIVLSGCSTYSSSFSCGDARGANCMSMDRVDRMIANGEIENLHSKKKNCRGRKCTESEKHDALLQPMTKAAVSDYQLSGEEI
ncbi:MAG: hypothetical protein K9G65_03145 [Rickettsiaceae bacterium]|jgi:hypothetical protein|nr:hypothetical protein [Rickettsiaceae bacterium]